MKNVIHSKSSPKYSYKVSLIQLWIVFLGWHNDQNMMKVMHFWLRFDTFVAFFLIFLPFYSFLLWITHFLNSFNNSFNCAVKIFIYSFHSFKKNSKLFIQRIYSFKKILKLIHSNYLFIQTSWKWFIKKTLPEAQRTHNIESVTGVSLLAPQSRGLW